MVGEVIADPISSLPLQEVVKPEDKVVIIPDDFGRLTPKRDRLTCLIDHLVRFRLAYSEIFLYLNHQESSYQKLLKPK
jgi:nickel-dependent lactate racemase